MGKGNTQQALAKDVPGQVQIRFQREVIPRVEPGLLRCQVKLGTQSVGGSVEAEGEELKRRPNYT